MKKEIATLHARLDKELDEIRDKIEKLEGKPGKGRGKGRLQILGGAEIADIEHEAASVEPAPAARDPKAPVLTHGGLQTVASEADAPGFHPAMTIEAAHRAHDGAADVFAAHHLPSCTDCPVSEFESVSDGAGDHGVDVAALVADLNRLVSA